MSAISSEPGNSDTQDTNIKHRANHSSALLFLSIHTHEHRANHSVQYSLRVWVKKQTFQLVSNIVKSKLTLATTKSQVTRHVNEFSHDKRNCLLELR